MKNIERIKDYLQYLESHNKNYTKRQYETILDLIDLINEAEKEEKRHVKDK